ncbi:MAG: hypothetical protein IJS58_04505 [Bacilli bacterium]|nr:hypothetical protein [Bacilli bacterium]
MLRKIGEMSVIYVCINHPVIDSIRYLINAIFGEKIEMLQLVMVDLMSILLLYGVGKLIMKTKIKILFEKKDY